MLGSVASICLATALAVTAVALAAQVIGTVRLGLALLGTAVALGVRSLLGRLLEPGAAPSAPSFASEQEHLWATAGGRVAIGIGSLGVVLVVIGLIL